MNMSIAERMAHARSCRTGKHGPKKHWVRRAGTDEREMPFLDYFFSVDSPIRGNAYQSALKAGYSETTALDKAGRIIKRFGDLSAAASLNAVGINKPYLAARIKQVLEKGGDKEILSAARLAFALLGEATDSSGGVTVNSTAPVMVIVGASSARLKALRGAIPQLTPEQKQLADEEESANRLEAFKRGELGFISKHSKAKIDEQETLLDVQSGPIELPPEAPADAG